MQTIGKFGLKNEMGAVVKLQCVYWPPNSKDSKRTDGTGTILLGQRETMDPGNHKPEVPSGCLVSIYVDVQAGIDRTGNEQFIYEAGSPIRAEYVVSGIAPNPTLGLVTVN